MDLKLYDEALMNIQWAKENGYPAEKLAKLNEREQKCKELKEKLQLDQENDPWDFFKLSYPPNPKIPFIVNSLEMKETKKDQRGIYTTEDLKPGDIIAIDKAIFYNSYHIGDEFTPRYLHCCNCMKTNKMNLIPCPKQSKML